MDDNEIEQDHDTAGAWWRWPLMPIVSVAAGALGYSFILLISWLMWKLLGIPIDGWFGRLLVHGSGTCAFGGVWVRTAYMVSPWGKYKATIVMATILSTLLILGTVLVWLRPEYGPGEEVLATLISAGALFSIIGNATSLRHGMDMSGSDSY